MTHGLFWLLYSRFKNTSQPDRLTLNFQHIKECGYKSHDPYWHSSLRYRETTQMLPIKDCKTVRLLATICVVVAAACLGNNTQAFPVPVSQPLTQVIAQSDTVVVARLVSYAPDPTDQIPVASRTPSGQMFYMGMDAFLVVNRLKPRGLYTFEVLQTLKGRSEKDLQVKLPRLLAHYYGGARLKVEPGDKVLLLLKRDAKAQWSVTTATLPLIPLSPDLSLAVAPTATPEEPVAPAQSRVLSLMLSGLTDPNLRTANTYLVRKTLAPQVVTGLVPYLNDSQMEIRDYVFYGLATNQQVRVIPLIGALQKTLGSGDDPNSQSLQALETLQHFNTPTALPYLNPLLFEEPRITRVNVILGLPNLADRTSVPYLLLALRDPDPRHFIGPAATQILHKMIPALRANKVGTEFLAQFDKAAWGWWQDELAGKHPLAPNAPAPAVTLAPDQKFVAADLPQLNLGLFMLSEITRRAAARGLEGLADASSIPYLLVALYDPLPDVAFSANIILHRLVPELGPATAQAQWQTQREQQTTAAFDWWQKHLLDAETPPVPSLAPGQAPKISLPAKP